MTSTTLKKLPVNRKKIDSTPPPPPPPCSQVRVRWSDLKRDVLYVIFRKLQDYDPGDNNNTIYRCGNVCVSWQSVARSILPRYWLLSNENSCTFFNLFTKRVREISLPEELEGRWFSVSSFGWLLTIGIESPHKIALINPFSPDHIIELPEAIQICNVSYFNRDLRVIMSTNPLDPNCVFVAVSGDFIDITPAFCKLGDESWTIMSKCAWIVRSWGVYEKCDARFYKGEFYSVDHKGNLFRVHLNSSSSFMIHYRCTDWPIPKSQTNEYRTVNYLVELNGDLLLVGRKIGRKKEYENTIGFDVYKWIQDEEEWSADPVKDIGNNVILLGQYSSVTVPAGPDVGDWKSNCIYFKDDVRYLRRPILQHYKDAGVYNIASREIDRLPESWPRWMISRANWLSPM
ncbi:hypothetical protein LWI29_006861 [Acer saccharum]|uniref:KIB1-4 beta-propeller domain-containing protein n=1 Tax=Acer saccharum TaxID=4024 RepID=A0AA39VUL2_ACESA|nr:hypothetical protein LWI29_006861 [Acer saccharum]